MRVDLAAQVFTMRDVCICGLTHSYFQVLSECVHKALVATGGEAAQGTACFVLMMDRFFDCINVSSFNQGKRKRKPFQNPYRSASDFRLKVCSFCNIQL